jgi:succinoglycan biosynthesis protein ExoM
MLEQLLKVLADQISSCPDVLGDVFVLDNDPQRSAEPVVSKSIAIYKHVEPTGLSFVRNAALQIGSSYDFLVMIDDDQLAEPGWLGELLRVQQSSDADAVIGPVVHWPVPPTPKWIAKGQFFRPTVYSKHDGARIFDGNSGNCLMKMTSIAASGLRFDERLNFTGGEDQFFFKKLNSLGMKIVFAKYAIATETVPSQRQTARWIISLNFRRGSSLGYCDVHIQPTRWKITIRFAKGIARIALGIILAIPKTIFAAKSGVVSALGDIAFGVGMISGLLSIRTASYKR